MYFNSRARKGATKIDKILFPSFDFNSRARKGATVAQAIDRQNAEAFQLTRP